MKTKFIVVSHCTFKNVAFAQNIFRTLFYSIACLFFAQSVSFGQPKWDPNGTTYLITNPSNTYVGIGTSTPEALLNIHNSNSPTTDGFISLKLTTALECRKVAELGIANANGFYSSIATPGDAILRVGGDCGEDLILASQTQSGQIRFTLGGINEPEKERMRLFHNGAHTLLDIEGNDGLQTQNDDGSSNSILRFIRIDRTNLQSAWMAGLDSKDGNKFKITADLNSTFDSKFPNLVITRDGNIGIGQNTPLSKLHIGGRYTEQSGTPHYNYGWGQTMLTIGDAPVWNGNTPDEIGGLAIDFPAFGCAIKNGRTGNLLEHSWTNGEDAQHNPHPELNYGNYTSWKNNPDISSEHGDPNASPYNEILMSQNKGIIFKTAGQQRMSIDQNGLITFNGSLGSSLQLDQLVDIGDAPNHYGFISTSPNYKNYKLSVRGKIIAQEIVVTTTGWADFVFDANYKLPTLAEVEQSIEKEKHLPGIPSATEVANNGVAVGEMQAKLLQKVEELTLYVIQLQKQNEGLQSRLSTLESNK